LTAFIFLGGAAFIVGLGLSLMVSTSAARSFVATLVGLLAVAALLAIAFLTAPTSAAESFHDQGEYAGRWLDPVIFIAAIFNVAAWFMGVLLGALFRRDDRGEPDGRVYGALSWMLVGFTVLLLWIVVS
jgi:hypothetical protein